MSLWDWLFAAWIVDKIGDYHRHDESEDFWGTESSSFYDDDEFDEDFEDGFEEEFDEEFD